jgi:hypothetical protein
VPHDAEPRAHCSTESCCGLVCAGLEREHLLRRVGKDELVAQALAWESLAETLWMRLLAETQALLAHMSLANVMDARLFLSQEELEPALVQHAVRGERGRERVREGGAERERARDGALLCRLLPVAGGACLGKCVPRLLLCLRAMLVLATRFCFGLSGKGKGQLKQGDGQCVFKEVRYQC